MTIVKLKPIYGYKLYIIVLYYKLYYYVIYYKLQILPSES